MKIHISHVGMSEGAKVAPVVFGHDASKCHESGSCGSGMDLPLPHLVGKKIKAGDVIDDPPVEAQP